MTPPRRRSPLAALLAWSVAGAAAAAPLDDLIVFGDSLSDVGNVNASTFGIQPGSAYFQGRFSNGPVYAERLSEALGFGSLSRSGAGGDNYAFGGAQTNGPQGFFNGDLFIDSLVEQVDAFLGRLRGAPANPDALHVVFLGANDLFDGQTNVATPVGVVQTQLTRLVAAGARRFLGVNLPRLGLTPDNAGNGFLSSLSTQFNTALDAAYNAVEAATPGVDIHRLDVAGLFDELVASPDRWGFTNTTGRGIDATDPAGFVFWDGVHPTREAHALLGEAAARAVTPQGDFDRDGFVTAADYAVWSAGRGARFSAVDGLTTGVEADANFDGRVDAADYTVWRLNAAAATAATPEPSASSLVATACAVIASRRRRR